MLPHALGELLPTVDLFARAGGGGSSSGGGGGDGFIIVVGYLPMHALGAGLRRINKKYPAFTVALCILCIVMALAYGAAWIVFLGGFFGGLTAIAALIGALAGLFGWFGKLRQSKQAEASLATAAQQDPAWNEERLLVMASSTFLRYQADWSTQNIESMKTYMTPSYHQHASLLVVALGQLHRINKIENPIINELMVVDLADSPGVGADRVTIGITARSNDRLIDSRTEEVLYEDNGNFTEFWKFCRTGDGWLLNGIQQATAAEWLHNEPLEQFAQRNGMYFSLDMGRLLVPKRGVIFDKASLKTADVNNHVIGLYAQQYLVQLYTYTNQPVPNTDATIYLVAQMMVPKEYGQIVVRQKTGNWLTRTIGFNTFGSRGLQKISMEWGDFNRKYDVYASSAEGATSFELLHPAFMEQLERVPFEVNIEVVDNVVYFYAKEQSKFVPNSYYEDLLKIVHEAYRQMRL